MRTTDRGVRLQAAVAPGIDRSLITGPSRPNVLLVGPYGELETFLRSLDIFLRPPVFEWPRDGCPWETNRTFRTVVLRQVDTLSASHQERLMHWLDRVGARVQVISLARAPIFPLVERAAFLDRLYYRLNIVHLACY